MKIDRNTVALIHYRLRNTAGALLESSFDDEPVALLHGHGNVIRGLEQALTGREAGERFEVSIAPELAYGPRQEDRVQRLSKKYFQAPARLKAGMQTVVHTEEGRRPVTVIKVGNKVVDVDLNHPLAGEQLEFEVEILEVRAAAPEEVAHGHAHADGKHHH